MNFKSIAKSLAAVLLNPFETKIVRKHQFSETVCSNHFHIRLAADWLLKAQQNSPDYGYSRFYSLYQKKWDRGYIETTGYIIPTMLQVSEYLKDNKYKQSAMQAADWLLEIQNSNGSFSDIDAGDAQVFDTGQCLLGLNYLYSYTKENRFLEAAKKAGEWLIQEQENNGSWVQHAYLGIPHTYYTRVAAALIELGTLCNQQHYVASGMKNINWVISRQENNGFFLNASFTTKDNPILHTLVYILEGLLHAFRITKQEYILKAILKNAEQFKDINLHREIILYSQYDETYNATDKSKCITGLAQWAGVCLELYEITNDDAYLKLAIRTIHYLKSKQIKDGVNTKGGFTGSIPFYAHYGAGKFLNWNNKFFIDALLKFEKYDISIDDEHEEWVSASFSFIKEIVSHKFSEADKSYIKYIEQEIKKQTQNITLVDLGCGKGKFIKYLGDKYPSMKIIGIDPFFFAENKGIKQGSAYKIPMPEQSADILIAIEVLQHVKDINKALLEINRVLKDDGVLIIGERNSWSGLGLLKPFLERMNKWMYISDSPFIEKWYPKSKWQELLNNNGYHVDGINRINVIGGKIPLLNRYYCILGTKIK
jgi:ubiquinone/menaquinone biosynthesis C-methylase UbiE/rhamnogalacturonyl hydrolase YesR